MTGWFFVIFRQRDGGAAPAAFDAPQGARLARWQARDGGLRWIDALVDRGDAIALGGDGYPLRYTARAEHIIPAFDAPPEARAVWAAGPHDVLTSEWAGTTAIEHAAVAACDAKEWLIVEVWDES